MPSSSPTIGVLALQGDFAEHIDILALIGAEALEVRTVEDLSRCNALILPGGESTVIMKLLSLSGLGEAIVQRVQSGMPVFGTCAGAILLSDSHLKLMDISVDRNAYGSQMQSFDADVSLKKIGAVHASFIRAPRITRTGTNVHILAEHENSVVCAEQGNMLVTTFHTEVTNEPALHEYFLRFIKTV